MSRVTQFPTIWVWNNFTAGCYSALVDATQPLITFYDKWLNKPYCRSSLVVTCAPNLRGYVTAYIYVYITLKFYFLRPNVYVEAFSTCSCF